MKYDIFVLFPINPQSLAMYRQAFALSRAKDDPTDAALALEMLSKHRDQLRPLRPQDAPTRALAQITAPALFCDFLITWPTLAKLQRARPKTLERFFHCHNVRRRHSLANASKRLKGLPP